MISCVALAFACGADSEEATECVGDASETRVRFATATVPFGGECMAEQQARTCGDGQWSAWSGTYAHETCSEAAPRSCEDPPAAHGALDERTRYEAAQVAYDETCQAEVQTRSCSDGAWGAWSGTFAAEICVVAEPRRCADPDADHGATAQRTRYATASVVFGATCVGEDQFRTCTDGAWSAWSGTFAEPTCTVDPPLACVSPDAPHGALDTRTRYATASVAYGQACQAELQERSCANGAWSAWSGTYVHAACTEPVLVGMRIVPGKPVLAVDEPLAFRVVGTLDTGGEQDVTDLVTWSSADPQTVTFSGPPGTAMGVAPGSTTVAADHASVHAEVVATVRRWTRATVASYVAGDVEFAGDQRGRMIAVWGEDGVTPGSGAVMTRVWQAGWLPSVAIAEVNDEFSKLRAAINPRGDQHVMWLTPNRATSLPQLSFVHASERGFQATSWSPPRTLSSRASYGAPALALAHAGPALATWIDDGVQCYAAFSPQAGWPQALTYLVARRGYDVAIDPLGNGIVQGADTWLSPTVGSGIYAYHHDRTSNTVGPRLTVYETANTSGMPTYEDARRGPIGMDALGNALVVWVREDGSGVTLMSSRFVPGSGWQPPQVIQALGNAQVSIGNLSVHASGTAAFSFSSNFGVMAQRIFAVTYTPQLGWGTPTPLSSPGVMHSLPDQHETIATAADGRALAMWSEPAGSVRALIVRRYDPDTGWGPAETIDVAVAFLHESAFGLVDGFIVGYLADYGNDVLIRSATFR